MYRARQQLVGFISIIGSHGVTPTRRSERRARLRRQRRALAGSGLDRLVVLVRHILVRYAPCGQQSQTLRGLVIGELSRLTITTRKHAMSGVSRGSCRCWRADGTLGHPRRKSCRSVCIQQGCISCCLSLACDRTEA
uniref:Uncharacterized protein n=1 Tax=Hyaloperonospora arabidopsidis (strain Emoy2) TaxID=559515 RepID=M4BJN6_HYAAE